MLLALAILLGAAGGRRPRQARRLAVRIRDDQSTDTKQLRTLLDDRATVVANYVSALLLLAIIVLMVFRLGA